MSTQVQLTAISGNSKTGPIPVSTTESDTCPPNCGARDVCYAKGGPLNMHWMKVSDHVRGAQWAEFITSISALPKKQVWRHNQAGDLPGKGNRINAKELRQLVAANKGKRGFTYTHKPLTATNVNLIKSANKAGFTISISCDNLKQVDKAMQTGLPVVTMAPIDAPRKLITAKGNVSIGCPAAYREEVNCSNCGQGKPLCGRADRPFAVHFPVHGNRKNKANLIAN